MTVVQRRIVVGWLLIALSYILGFIFHHMLGAVLSSGIGWLVRYSCPMVWREMSPRWQLVFLVLFVAAMITSILCAYFSLPWLLWVRPVLEPLLWCSVVAMVLVVERLSFRQAGQRIA